MAEAMRIAAYVGVKDEVELVEATIKHLQAIGVDEVIVCDMMSTDGTFEVLKKLQSDEVRVTQMSDLDYSDLQTESQRIVDLVSGSSADWVVFLDADEYWIPATGSLKDCAALATSDVLSVARYNVPLGPRGPMRPDVLAPARYDELLLVVDAIPDFKSHLRDNPSTPWSRGVPMAKAMARRNLVRHVETGCHDVRGPEGVSLRRARPADLLIAHLPFTTLSRFERKVANIRRHFDVHDAIVLGDMAWHWRRWLAVAEQGSLEDEFQQQVFAPEVLTQLRDEGAVRSAAEIFSSWSPAR